MGKPISISVSNIMDKITEIEARMEGRLGELKKDVEGKFGEVTKDIKEVFKKL